MAANVALSDTFDQWRVKTNQLLAFTQSTGGDDFIFIANTTESNSTTSGAFTVSGGAGIAKSVQIGKRLTVTGNTTFDANVVVGESSSDVLVINSKIQSDILPSDTNTYALGNTNLKFSEVVVEGYVGGSAVSALQIPVGTTGERPPSVQQGQIRYNTSDSTFEGYDGSNWGSLGGVKDIDQDTKIAVEVTSDEDTIRFYTGNTSTSSTEVANFAPNGGNVAIGTAGTYGDAKLQVVGTANVSGNVVFGESFSVQGNTTLSNTTIQADNFTSNATSSYIAGNNFYIEANTTTVNSTFLSVLSNTTISGANTNVEGSLLRVLANTTISGANTNIEGEQFIVTSNSDFNAANTNIGGGFFRVASNTVYVGETTTISGQNFIANANTSLRGDSTLVDGVNFIIYSNTNFSSALTTVGGTTFEIFANTNIAGSSLNINSTSATIHSNTTFNGPVVFNNVVSIEAQTTVNSNAEIVGSLIVGGDLTVTGSTVSISSQNLSVDDNKIYLNGGNTAWSTTQTVGSGSPSVAIAGQYEGNANTTYIVKIVSTSGGAGGVAQAQYSDDNGSTYSATFDISGTSAIALNNGITATFSATTGYTLNDEYSASVVTVNIDLGWAGNYNDGVYRHAGIFRDATDGVFKFFHKYIPEPDDAVDINTSHATFELAPLAVSLLSTANLAVTDTFTFGGQDFQSVQYFALYNANNVAVTSGYLLNT